MPIYNMPDPGEGLTEADIVEWHVAEGDEIKVNDDLLDIETAKSLVELPSPFAGTVTKIYSQAGTTIEVGKPLIFIDDGSGDAPVGDEDAQETKAGKTPAQPESEKSKDSVDTPDLSGAMVGEALIEPEKLPVHAADQPVRQMLVGYGPADDKLPDSTSRRRRAHQVSHRTGAGRPARDEEIPVDTVRRLTAKNVIASRRNKVHTSAWVSRDVTGTMELVHQLRESREFAGLHVTPLLVWCKAVCLAMRHNPMLNASWEPDSDRIIVHNDVNIGIAADTPRGLMVPVIRHAQDRDLVSMATELTRLVNLAKTGTLQPSDYRDGTFTITNVGGLGLDAGTPIINGSESAILAMGTIKRQPWVVGKGADERIEPRWVTQMAISFDHRLIDGAIASRFLGDLADLVANPAMAMGY